jgi:hypothetical protein
MPIFASGTVAGKALRKTTGQWEWDKARVIAAKFEAQGSWSSSKAELRQPVSPPQSAPRITIERAIKAFTVEFEEHAAPNTQKKISHLAGKTEGVC